MYFHISHVYHTFILHISFHVIIKVSSSSSTHKRQIIHTHTHTKCIVSAQSHFACSEEIVWLNFLHPPKSGFEKRSPVLVRSHLECCGQHGLHDIRNTWTQWQQWCSGLKHTVEDDKLQKLGLSSLRKRRWSRILLLPSAPSCVAQPASAWRCTETSWNVENSW